MIVRSEMQNSEADKVSVKSPPEDDLEPSTRASAFYGSQYYENQMDVPQEAYEWISRGRARKLADHVKPTDRVFEFGVGSGFNLAFLSCERRVGYDINPDALLQAAKYGIEIVSDHSILADESFDAVICHHVLEHLLDPAAALSRLVRLVDRNGKLILFVPYEEQSRYRRYRWDEPNRHLFSWTPQSFGNLIAACGLKPVEIGLKPFGYDRIAAITAYRFGIGEVGFRAIRSLGLALRPEREICVVAVRQ